MKSYSYKILAASALTTVALALTGCQQTPPTQTVAVPVQTPASAPAPTTSSESTVVTKSTEVKPADPANPDEAAQKTTTTESTTVKRKQP